MGAFRSQAGKLEDILGDEGHAVLLACQDYGAGLLSIDARPFSPKAGIATGASSHIKTAALLKETVIQGLLPT